MSVRNIWLILRREYMERVRSRAFVLSTVLVPVFMFAVTVGPQKLAMMKTAGTRRLVVVTSNAGFASALGSQLKTQVDRKFNITVDSNPSQAEREVLRAKLDAGQIDAYLWATDEAIAARRMVYAAHETSDFIELAGLRDAITMAAMEQQLASRGVAAGEVEQMMKPFAVDTVHVEAGKETKRSARGAFVVAFGMVIFLYSILLMYGALVMQAVLEEKSSRIVEVLLASVSSDELMMGKIFGVGAAGLSQVLIWAMAGLAFSTPALATIKSMGVTAEIPPAVMIYFPVFFLLGFLLYAASFAAVGAAVNSMQEAQQFNFIVMSPIILSIVLMMMVIREPNAPLSVGMSLFPFTAPILMYLRITVQHPPAWQIALSIALLIAAVFVMMWLCARIYRVGILMYGKRPTLPEILKWVRYA